MHRRSLLSWLGASAAGALSFSKVTEARPQSGTRVVSLESFSVRDADEMLRLHDYLGGTLFPVMSQVHNGPAIYLDAIVAPRTPQALFVAVFSNFDEMIDVRGRIASHPRIQQARADLESGPAFCEVQSQVLTAKGESLRLNSERKESGIFELRSYHASGWHDGPPAVFGEALNRAGIHPILNGSSAAGEHVPQLTFLIPFENLAAREEAWSRLDRDAEWINVRKNSAVKVTGKSIYKLAPYSNRA
jgi:NIPSNAP